MDRIHVSTVIDAPIDDVWNLIRDFDATPKWIPAVASSEIEQGRRGDSVGCVRRLTLGDGAVVREVLLALSDRERRFAYAIVECPLPIEGYVATVRLQPVTEQGTTYMEWSSEFRTESLEEMVAVIKDGLYLPAMASIQEQLAGRR